MKFAIYVLLIFSMMFISCDLDSSVEEPSIEKVNGHIILTIQKDAASSRSTRSVPSNTQYVQIRLNDGTTNALKTVDVSTSNTVTVEIDLPPSTYELEVFALGEKDWSNAISPREILTYGATSNVVVTSGEYTSVSLTLEEPIIEVDYQNEVGISVDSLKGNTNFKYLVSTNFKTFSSYSFLLWPPEASFISIANQKRVLTWESSTAPDVSTSEVWEAEPYMMFNSTDYGQNMIYRKRNPLTIDPPVGGIYLFID